MAYLWEDKEIRFDIPYSEMRFRIGEKIIDRLENIEDTKGNAGDRGRFIITNLRILWHSLTSPRINISIGFNTILSINTKIINSKIRTTTQALHMMATFNSRFEFIFTNMVPGNMRHFTSVMEIYKAYNSSRLYRELKLRGAVVHNKQLIILPLEQIFSTLYGVWNLSTDQGSLGTFIITNIRLVWFADMNEGFNISLPYLQTDTIKICDSKFGTALVVTSSDESGGYVLGFKVDPPEKMRILFKELISLHAIYTTSPIFGVEYKWSSHRENVNQKQNIIDDLELDDTQVEVANDLSAYLAEESKEKDSAPVYSPELGLAIESVKDGYTLTKLWEVIST